MFPTWDDFCCLGLLMWQGLASTAAWVLIVPAGTEPQVAQPFLFTEPNVTCIQLSQTLSLWGYQSLA